MIPTKPAGHEDVPEDVKKLARDLYERLFRVGKHRHDPVPFDPQAEIETTILADRSRRTKAPAQATDVAIVLPKKWPSGTKVKVPDGRVGRVGEYYGNKVHVDFPISSWFGNVDDLILLEDYRDVLGRVVRAAWVKWARHQSNPKASWLVPYDQLPDDDKEADRQIGEALSAYAVSAPAEATELAPDVKGLVERLRNDSGPLVKLTPGVQEWLSANWALREEAADALSRLSAPLADASDDQLDALLLGCAQILDAVAIEWMKDGSWSKWDQSIRDGIGRKLFELSGTPVPDGQKFGVGSDFAIDKAAEAAMKAVRDAQDVLAEYLPPDSGVSETECVNRLLGILDHQDLVRAMRVTKGAGHGE